METKITKQQREKQIEVSRYFGRTSRPSASGDLMKNRKVVTRSYKSTILRAQKQERIELHPLLGRSLFECLSSDVSSVIFVCCYPWSVGYISPILAFFISPRTPITTRIVVAFIPHIRSISSSRSLYFDSFRSFIIIRSPWVRKASFGSMSIFMVLTRKDMVISKRPVLVMLATKENKLFDTRKAITLQIKTWWYSQIKLNLQYSSNKRPSAYLKFWLKGWTILVSLYSCTQRYQ